MTDTGRAEPQPAHDHRAVPADFEVFFRAAEPHLRAALTATFGPETGRDACAEALTYAWRNWDRVRTLDNPRGYLFRVGQRWAHRHRTRSERRYPAVVDDAEPVAFEPLLGEVLAGLSTRQRQAVVLCVGYGLTHAEAAALLGIERSSVQNHVERALRHLRHHLGADR